MAYKTDTKNMENDLNDHYYMDMSQSWWNQSFNYRLL